VSNTLQTMSADGFDKIITVIMTDGEENSSREWTLQAVRELIQRKEAAGNSTFVFLGANLDTFTQGASLEVPMASSVRYDPANYRGVYASLAQNTTGSRPTQSRPLGTSSKEQSQASRSPDMCGQTLLRTLLCSSDTLTYNRMSGGEMLMYNPGQCARYLRPYWNWMDVPSFKLIRNTYSSFG
jgi:hypothetical protein